MDLHLRGKKDSMEQSICFCDFSGEARRKNPAESTNGKSGGITDDNSNARVTTPGISSTINVYLEKTSRGSSPMGTDRGLGRGEGVSSISIIQLGSFCSVPNNGRRKSRIPKNGLISIPPY